MSTYFDLVFNDVMPDSRVEQTLQAAKRRREVVMDQVEDYKAKHIQGHLDELPAWERALVEAVLDETDEARAALAQVEADLQKLREAGASKDVIDRYLSRHQDRVVARRM